MALAMANGEMTRRPFTALGVSTWVEALRYCRVERGLTFQDLLRSVGRDNPEGPRKWEEGKALPTRLELEHLYRALPKLRNYAHLLPDELRHDKAAEPTGRAAPAHVLAEAAEPHTEPKAPTTFGAALGAALVREGMTHGEFGAIAGFTQSTISAYIRGSRAGNGEGRGRKPVGITPLAYERLIALLPELTSVPKPRLSKRHWKVIPGKDGKHSMPVSADLKALDTGEAEPATRRPPPPMPETLRRPRAATPVVVAPKAPAAPPRMPRSPEDIQAGADAITQAGAAWGVAIANLARLRAQVADAELAVEESRERMNAAIENMGGQAISR